VRILALLTLALVLASTATASSSSWKTHRSAAGFSVAAPGTFVDVTSLTPDVLGRLGQLPALRQYVDLVKSSKSIKLLLADVSPTSVSARFATNMNVVQLATIGDLKLHQTLEVAQLKASGFVAGDVSSSLYRLPAGQTLRLAYRAKYSASSRTVSILQFIFVRNGRETALTYTTLPALASKYRAAFLRSARSFRFGA
jgi:hypothetical protein